MSNVTPTTYCQDNSDPQRLKDSLELLDQFLQIDDLTRRRSIIDICRSIVGSASGVRHSH